MTQHRIGPETERMRLRAMTPADTDAFFQLNSHPEVMRYTGEPLVTSREEAARAIGTYPDFDTIGYGRWACELKATGEMIGFCGLKYLADLDVVDLGYRFLPEYWGRGLATESALASVQFGWEVLDLKTIVGLVLPGNAASIRVLEKVGMQLLGARTYDQETVLRYEINRQ